MSVAARAGLLVLLALLAGCLHDQRRKVDPPLAPRPPEVEAPAELVYIDFALIERPLGDDYLNRGLWESADESVVPLEQLTSLEENGLRVCRLGGLLPSPLQALLTSRRSCPQPRRLRTSPGQPVLLSLGPSRSLCQFDLHTGDATRPIELRGAECVFEVVPRVRDGELVLRFVPQARFQEARRRAEAERAPDGSLRWGLAHRPPTDEFPAVAIEVPVSPGEFLVIGPRVGRSNTLGSTWFLSDSDIGPVQQLLVLRAARVRNPAESTGPASGPIALHVGDFKVRGVRP